MKNTKMGKVFDLTYRLNTSLVTCEIMNKVKDLESVLSANGFTKEEIVRVKRFINSTISEEEFLEYVWNKAINDYVDAVTQIKKYMDMAEGYQEMGNINLTISHEDHHLEAEVEGDTLYEVVRKEGTDNTKTR